MDGEWGRVPSGMTVRVATGYLPVIWAEVGALGEGISNKLSRRERMNIRCGLEVCRSSGDHAVLDWPSYGDFRKKGPAELTLLRGCEWSKGED